MFSNLENATIKQAQPIHIKWFVCFKKLIWWSLSRMQIWPTKKKKNPSCLLHNLLYMETIFIFTFYLLFYYLDIFYTNWIICEKCDFVIFFQRTKNSEGKYIVFWVRFSYGRKEPWHHALCHFWLRLMARAQTMDHHQFLLKNLNFFNILGFMCPLWCLNWILRSITGGRLLSPIVICRVKTYKRGVQIMGLKTAQLEQGSLNPKPMRSHQCKIFSRKTLLTESRSQRYKLLVSQQNLLEFSRSLVSSSMRIFSF